MVLLAIASVVFFSGCATKYQPVAYTGGYSETRLSENVFNVTFEGNAYTNREKSTDFTLLRSAELTLQNGYKYFTIINSENHVNLSIVGSGGDIKTSSKPSVNNTIVCFNEQPKINALVYKAEFIVESIKNKYSIE